MSDRATVIGAGLAGSEAAWQLAQRGFAVDLYEMRPESLTPAHHTDKPAELVCSNSLRSDSLTNAAGLLKEELRRLDSLIISAAEKTRVPAGNALAVDREKFPEKVLERLKNHDLIRLVRREIKDIPDTDPLIIATGPLTSDPLAESIKEFTGEDYLYFYDAAAPIIEAESIDYEKTFFASRYDRESDDYLNCPMDGEQFMDFWEFLLGAECNLPHDFEDENYFESCLPIEVLARRGRKSLLFGPLKPVGLENSETGETPHAVVQLRRDNRQETLFNLVGFQTRLKWPEQDRMLEFIPGLESARIVRYGVMHRNTYIDSPGLLTSSYRLRGERPIFFAGQLTGVEGYVESTSSGLVAGINCARLLDGENHLAFPESTATGALAAYISDPSHENLQPMNINFGLLPPLKVDIDERQKRRRRRSEQALKELEDFIEQKGI
ncbi:methylenetetrahydrofolate--tRNA-(uracil(54)-C(5))-methyltransferase (FADH(2)-oxidizing) TrmFO [Halarsenatibacter silvermanii]|uniref:Methylenetetrahydrofolate--tRNA-(uracil-5-)-methyltransferase TrmFO n=1 Tax=Halarsenatibacter silvermanii TaxID=321763 RepID=A0A1G9LFV1_9FIRM|nr:methylenetetrahydrofolate--tRNA-(uracil(54)-C(5))-methyltransferase (FADH(2)-oxidizing) TrmFO [Halarsenatibacter silvermanii]SDL60395.1 methylenetetrahydrofolate--tRNA-(uracil-5-)-methyltransferase [Halarsenatibacter silvermanii]